MGKPLRTLIIEDSEDDALLIVRTLQKGGFESTWTRVQTAEDLQAALAQEEWDIVICDYRMPRFNAPAALQAVKEAGLDLPFIVVSGIIGEEAAVKMMRSGAHDYVMKDNLQRLPEAVRREIREADIRQERRRAEASLRQRSRELEILNDLGRSLNRTLTLEEVVRSAISGAINATGSDLALLFRRKNNELLLCGLGPESSLFLDGEYHRVTHRVGKCLCGLAVSEGKSIFSKNIHNDPRCTMEECKKVGLRSCATLALYGADEIMGILALAKFEEYDFEQQESFLETMASQISTAINNAILHDKVVQHANMLRTIFHNVPAGIGLLQNGIFKWINGQLSDLTGYSESELLKRHENILFLSDEEYSLTQKDLYAQIRETGKGTTETRWRRKDGQIIDVFLGLSPIDPDDSSQGFVCSAQNITERKYLEYQLTVAQKLEAVGILAGGIAHDFNNLLTAIIGHSEIMLLDLPEGDPLSQRVRDILEAAFQSNSLTKQLLAFSRRQVIQLQVVNLNDVISEMENMIKRLIRDDIELAISLDPDLGLIKADPGQLQQIIMNLVVNSCDAMPASGQITIKTANTYLGDSYKQQDKDLTPGKYVILTVKDTGIGMDQKTQANIFDPFFTTKEVGKGTGLGLSTLYGIIKQNKGMIKVSSEPGKGATFEIYLPQVEDTISTRIVKTEIFSSEIEKPETILVVEDNEASREIVVLALKKFGYKVLEASDGAKAMEICDQYRGMISLLLTDVVMPEISGKQLADMLTQLHPEMKVLYMSGYTDDEIVRHGVMNNDFNFLQKPFKLTQLLEKIKEVLDS